MSARGTACALPVPDCPLWKSRAAAAEAPKSVVELRDVRVLGSNPDVPARTGAEFLDDLRGAQRAVWIDGELITDPTTHPTTRGGAASLAELFDRQHKFADECLISDPETGEAINISHMLPRSLDDLRRRQVGLARLSEGTAGLMGRTPDYMNMKFSAFGSAPWVWAGDDGRNAQRRREHRRLPQTPRP